MSEKKIYVNSGNLPLIELIKNTPKLILDVGCGAGNNAELIRSRYPESIIEGVTYSEAERNIAVQAMNKVLVFDIEGDIPVEISSKKYDLLIFSHVLEHLRNPKIILQKFLELLEDDGMVLIAVPNLLVWYMRLKFIFGEFNYEKEGILDDTHLRFFTYFNIEDQLMGSIKDYKVTYKNVSGSIPLGPLRRYFLPNQITGLLDKIGCKYFPNLFGNQIIMVIKKIN